jgi:NAD-dependent SIR2 family protein deacetylase
MKLRLLLVLGLGLLVMGITAVMTYPPKAAKKKKSFDDEDAVEYKFMHCPKCHAELPFDKQTFADGCPQCQYPRLEPTTESVNSVVSMEPSPYNRMAASIFVELVVLLGVVWFVLRPRRKDGVVVYFRMRCPKCNQKIRFNQAQAGRPGGCRKCKKMFLFPTESLVEDDEPADRYAATRDEDNE